MLRIGWGVAAGMLVVGCANTPFEVSRRDDERLRSKVERLMLLVSIQVPSPPRQSGAEPSSTPKYLNPEEILGVRLRVDGKPLGSFDTQATQRAPSELRATSETALVIAELGELSDLDTLHNLGDWVDAFQRGLSSGSHVLEMTEVKLRRPTDAKPRVLPTRVYLPFTVPDGSATTYAGHVQLSLEESSP